MKGGEHDKFDEYGQQGRTKTNGKSAGELTKEISQDFSTLVRKEIELAKQELSQSVTAKLRGAAGLALACLLGSLAVTFILLAVPDGTAVPPSDWAGDLITAALLLGSAAATAIVGKVAGIHRGTPHDLLRQGNICRF